MSMSDPIADMLTRIRNAGSAKLPEVLMPASKLKIAVAEVLKEQGYIADYSLQNEGTPEKSITLQLKYKGKHSEHVVEGIERISKPSCRVYVDNDHIPRVLGGLGVAIISTSQGVMTGRAAQKQNLGGEVLCYVW